MVRGTAYVNMSTQRHASCRDIHTHAYIHIHVHREPDVPKWYSFVRLDKIWLTQAVNFWQDTAPYNILSIFPHQQSTVVTNYQELIMTWRRCKVHTYIQCIIIVCMYIYWYMYTICQRLEYNYYVMTEE